MTSWRSRILVGVAPPVLAVMTSVLIASIVLLAAGSDPAASLSAMLRNGAKLETVVDIVNRATPLFLAGVAASIGFRARLLNIGLDGQYLLAAFVSAIVGANVILWAPLHVALIITTAVVVGAAWSGLAALLKVTRGVSEVISTIMLNFIAVGGIIAALLPSVIEDPTAPNQGTPTIAASGWMPSLNALIEPITGSIHGGRQVEGILVIAVVVGLAYHIVINRSRIGYDIRASGMSPRAARAAGVPPKRIVLVTMLASGAVAGLIGMPDIISGSHGYNQGIVRGLGTAGLAVAILGRGSALGMAVAAIAFGFLDSSAAVLQVKSLAPREIVVIMQATSLLVSVVAYEVAAQYRRREQTRIASMSSGPASLDAAIAP